MIDNVFDGKTATIIGMGGVGTIIANRLLRLNMTLRIIDRDRIFIKDLARQNLYSSSLDNKFKAKEAKKLLDLINPEASVKAFHEDLMEENSFLLQGDIIIDASNDLKTNAVVHKKAEADNLKVVQINYAGTEASVKYYQGKTEDNTFKKTIEKEGCSPELPELASGIAIHIVGQVFSKKKPAPETKLDTKKLVIN